MRYMGITICTAANADEHGEVIFALIGRWRGLGDGRIFAEPNFGISSPLSCKPQHLIGPSNYSITRRSLQLELFDDDRSSGRRIDSVAQPLTSRYQLLGPATAPNAGDVGFWKNQN
jgi:hypothetical protein